MSRTVAIVEDEPAIRENYADLLQRHGYRVQAHADRVSAQEAFGARLPDLVLLDIGLGDEIDGGFELCRALRARSARLPIIFLTARDSDFDAVSGLRLGADDYLSKDVSLPQLMARIAALFRRVDSWQAGGDAETLLEDGPLCMDLDRLSTRWKGRQVDLTVTEFWILQALVHHPGHVKNRGQLMEAAQTYVDQATVTSHIKRMRRKFAQVDPGFSAIESVYGAGYRWVAQAR